MQYAIQDQSAKTMTKKRDKISTLFMTKTVENAYPYNPYKEESPPLSSLQEQSRA